MPAPKVCSTPGCPNIQPCATHQRKPWEGSTRRTHTISGSRQQKRARWVLHHHNHTCHACGQPDATQVDHVIPLAEGGPDTLDNLRPIHVTCHQQKTQAEARRGRAA